MDKHVVHPFTLIQRTSINHEVLQKRKNSVYFSEYYVIIFKLLEQHCQLKLYEANVHHIRGHEGPEGRRCIAILFL
jgi:hypothetical protein